MGKFCPVGNRRRISHLDRGCKRAGRRGRGLPYPPGERLQGGRCTQHLPQQLGESSESTKHYAGKHYVFPLFFAVKCIPRCFDSLTKKGGELEKNSNKIKPVPGMKKEDQV